MESIYSGIPHFWVGTRRRRAGNVLFPTRFHLSLSLTSLPHSTAQITTSSGSRVPQLGPKSLQVVTLEFHRFSFGPVLFSTSGECPRMIPVSHSASSLINVRSYELIEVSFTQTSTFAKLGSDVEKERSLTIRCAPKRASHADGPTMG